MPNLKSIRIILGKWSNLNVYWKVDENVTVKLYLRVLLSAIYAILFIVSEIVSIC
jgi:hypothetical protein